MLHSQSLKGPLLVLVGALCFSMIGTMQAIAPAGSSPGTVAGVRMLLGSLSLFLYCLASGKSMSFAGWNWRAIFLYAGALWTFQILFFNSILVVGVAVGTVVSIGMTPIFSGLIDWLWKKRPPQKIWFFSTALAIVGVVLMNTFEGRSFNPLWITLPVICSFCYALELVAAKDLGPGVGAEQSMMVVTGLVGLGLLPFFFTDSLAWLQSVRGVGIALVLGVVTTACAFSCLTAGIRTTSVAMASTLGLAEPLGAALLGILFLGEPAPVQTVVGIVCIFASLIILILSSAKEATPQTKTA